ncbi:MAG: hypothetical protein FJ150_10675 [Euryarchaeota archaeon]|nr:hypothetical protein [Euryarchaeota archaeon]
MAKGFKKESKNQKKGYKTIFERVKDKAEGEQKSWQWYRKTVRTMALEYKRRPDKTILEERKDRIDPEDSQDENRLRRYARQGRLFLFEYKAKMKHLPYYDTFPLVYVIKAETDHFFGANLHYMEPRKRMIAIEKLKNDRIDIPRACFHKYILDHVDGFLLDLAIDEWDTSILLPVEHFVRERNGVLIPYKSSDVWKETDEDYGNKIRAKRIVKGYGKPEDIKDVTNGDI